MNRQIWLTVLVCCSSFTYAADIPTIVNENKESSLQSCIDSYVNNCVNTRCINSEDRNCPETCQQSAKAKCQGLNE